MLSEWESGYDHINSLLNAWWPQFIRQLRIPCQHIYCYSSMPLQKLLLISPTDFCLHVSSYSLCIAHITIILTTSHLYHTCRIESQLSTDCLCFLAAPTVITDCPPLSIDADLNTDPRTLPAHPPYSGKLWRGFLIWLFGKFGKFKNSPI